MSLYKKFIKTDNINNVFISYNISKKTATLKNSLLYVNSDTIIFITDPSVGNYIYTKGSLFGGIDSNSIASGEMDYDYIIENFISREEFTEFVESGNFSGSENIDTSNLLEKSSFEEYVTDVSNNYARKTDLDEFISDASAQNYVLNVSNYVSENYITNSSLNQIIIDTSSYIANNYVTKSEFEDHVENCGSSEDVIEEDSLDEFTIYNTRLMSFPNNSEELSNYSSIVDLNNINTDYIYNGDFSSLMELFMSETILTDIETAYENNPDLGTFLLDLIDYMNQNSEMAESPDYILACIANESIVDPESLQSLSEIDGIKLMFKAIEKISPLYILSHKILYNIYGNLYFPIYASNIFIFIEVDKDTLQPLRAFMINNNNEDGTTLMNDIDELYINMYTEDDNRTILTFETLPDIEELTINDLQNNATYLYVLLGKSLILGLYKENGKSEWDKDEVVYDTMCFPIKFLESEINPVKSLKSEANSDVNDLYYSYTYMKNMMEEIAQGFEIPSSVQNFLVNNPGVTAFTNRHIFASENGQYTIESFDMMLDMVNIIAEDITGSDENRLGMYVFLPKAKNEYWLFTNFTRLTYIEANPYDYASISIPVYAVNIEKNVITHGSFDYNLYISNGELVDLSSDSFIDRLEQYKKSVPSTTEIEGELSDMDEITRTFVKMFIINSSASANASAELSAIKGDIDTLAEFISKQHVDISKVQSEIRDFNEKLSNLLFNLYEKVNKLLNKIEFLDYLMHIRCTVNVKNGSKPVEQLEIPSELEFNIKKSEYIDKYIHDVVARFMVGLLTEEEALSMLDFSTNILIDFTGSNVGYNHRWYYDDYYYALCGVLYGRFMSFTNYTLKLEYNGLTFVKIYNSNAGRWSLWEYYAPRITVDNIYQQGYNVGVSASSYDLTDNPYDSESDNYDRWILGYNDGWDDNPNNPNAVNGGIINSSSNDNNGNQPQVNDDLTHFDSLYWEEGYNACKSWIINTNSTEPDETANYDNPYEYNTEQDESEEWSDGWSYYLRHYGIGYTAGDNAGKLNTLKNNSYSSNTPEYYGYEDGYMHGQAYRNGLIDAYNDLSYSRYNGYTENPYYNNATYFGEKQQRNGWDNGYYDWCQENSFDTSEQSWVNTQLTTAYLDGYLTGLNATYEDYMLYSSGSAGYENPYERWTELDSEWYSGLSDGWYENSNNPESPNYNSEPENV